MFNESVKTMLFGLCFEWLEKSILWLVKIFVPQLNCLVSMILSIKMNNQLKEKYEKFKKTSTEINHGKKQI